jgi:hypothetical protein
MQALPDNGNTVAKQQIHVQQEEQGMTRTYVSKVIPHEAGSVWEMVKNFNEYRWGEGVGESRIENDLDQNTPGAIRNFSYYGQQSRQRLVDYLPEQRMQSWESVEAFDPTLNHYKATLRVTPVTTTNHSFVEWWSDFDAPPEHVAKWQEHQEREFGKSLNRLERLLNEKFGQAA